MGSKTRIADKIFELFPEKENFYDLFCGGCSMAHYALEHGKYKRIFINDIDSGMPQLFSDAVDGKFRDERRWISREDFFRLKEKEAYVKICWSFGNKGKEYLYSKEVEPWKKALHFARVLGDTSLMREFGIDTDGSRGDIVKNHDEYKQKYILWYCKEILKTSVDVLELQKSLDEKVRKNSEELRAYLIEGLKKAGKRPSDVDRFLGTNGMAGHYFGKSQWEFPTMEVYRKLQTFLYLPLDYEKIYGLASLMEALQSLQSLQSLQRLQSLQSLHLSCGDYSDVKIKKNSIIYCDIPYENTTKYTSGAFDYERFYRWAERQTEPVFISSYSLPEERFVCIERIRHKSLFSSSSNHDVTEKVFIPRHQKDAYSMEWSLFGFDEL